MGESGDSCEEGSGGESKVMRYVTHNPQHEDCGAHLRRHVHSQRLALCPQHESGWPAPGCRPRHATLGSAPSVSVAVMVTDYSTILGRSRVGTNARIQLIGSLESINSVSSSFCLSNPSHTTIPPTQRPLKHPPDVPTYTLHAHPPCLAQSSAVVRHSDMSDLDEFLEPADLTNGIDEEPTIISSPRARAKKLPSRGKIAVDMDDVLW